MEKTQLSVLVDGSEKSAKVRSYIDENLGSTCEVMYWRASGVETAPLVYVQPSGLVFYGQGIWEVLGTLKYGTYAVMEMPLINIDTLQ